MKDAEKTTTLKLRSYSRSGSNMPLKVWLDDINESPSGKSIIGTLCLGDRRSDYVLSSKFEPLLKPGIEPVNDQAFFIQANLIVAALYDLMHQVVLDKEHFDVLSIDLDRDKTQDFADDVARVLTDLYIKKE